MFGDWFSWVITKVCLRYLVLNIYLRGWISLSFSRTLLSRYPEGWISNADSTEKKIFEQVIFAFQTWPLKLHYLISLRMFYFKFSRLYKHFCLRPYLEDWVVKFLGKWELNVLVTMFGDNGTAKLFEFVISPIKNEILSC